MKPASYLHRAKRTLAEDLIHYRRENEALKKSIESGIRLTVQYRQEIERLKALLRAGTQGVSSGGILPRRAARG